MTTTKGALALATDAASYLTPDPAKVRDVGSEADWPKNLTDWGRKYLRDRGVGPLVAAARGTHTVERSIDLPSLPAGVGFGQAVKRALNMADNQALVFPLHRAEGGSDIPQIRLRIPRQPTGDEKRGRSKPPKFETPSGAKRHTGALYPDIHPLALNNPPDAPLVITEGPGKADAIQTAALLEGIVVTPVLLTGVHMGYLSAGSEVNPGPTPVLVPKLADLIQPGRLVILAFDADRTTNPMVEQALRTTGRLTEAAGGIVMVADVPPVNGDTKAGIDDYLVKARAAGVPHPLATMLLAAQPLAMAIPERALTLVNPARTVPEALKANTGTAFPIAHDHAVVIGGERHGLWHLSSRYNTEMEVDEEVPEQVTDWIAWRSSKTSTLIADDFGRAAAPTDPHYDVQLVRRDGRTFLVPDLTGPESLDVLTVVTRADAAVTLPTGGTYLKEMIRNMISVLGQDRATGRDDLERLAATGWVNDARHGWVYCAPAGSVGVGSIITDLAVGPPIGSEEGALKPAQELTGWTEIAEGERLRNAAGAFKALVAIAPKRPEVGIAMLGALAAGPLALPRRASVILVAQPGVGKSIVASAAQAFVSAVEVNGSDFSFTFGEGSTRTGAELVLQWTRHGTAFFDDYRVVGDHESNRRSREAVNAIAQGVYSGAGKTQGTRNGGLRAQTSIRACAIITAEEEPAGGAIVERTVILNLVKGDIPTDGVTAIDRFRTQYAETGLARAAWASYLSYLAREIDGDADGLRGLRKRAGEVHRRYASTYGHARAGETVALIATGWHWLRQWANSEGIGDLMPTELAVRNALTRMVEANREQHRSEALDAQIVGALRSGIEGRRFYIAGPNRLKPANPGLCGWTPDDYGTSWQSRGLAVGFISSDGAKVLITSAGVKAALEALGMSELKSTQIDRAFAAVGYQGGSSKRAPMPLFDMGKATPRGWLIPADALGVDLGAEALGVDEPGPDEEEFEF